MCVRVCVHVYAFFRLTHRIIFFNKKKVANTAYCVLKNLAFK